MIHLSENQEQIVNHIDGAILVQAGPGSGKTRVLIERIKHLLLEKRRCRVLALTFSNLAADEMRNRLQEDDSFGELIENVTIGTIHSFCLELVQTRGNLIGLKKDMVIFENSADQQAVLRDAFSNAPNLLDLLTDKNKASKLLQGYLTMIAEQKKKFILPDMCDIEEPFPTIYREYNQSLLEQNALDFDDILFYAYRIFTENPSVVQLYNSLYRFICVDEAQDLNLAQYEVIKALCGTSCKNLMLVGDENQSIYGFNGSDSSIMSKRFVSDFSPTIYHLNENYRSARTIVRFANQLENYNSTSNYVYEGEIKAFFFGDEKQEAEFVLKKIQDLLKHGHADIQDTLSYQSFAVIGRNKYVLKNLEDLFQKQSIPYYYKRTSSGVENESDYMRVFELGIRLLLNSGDVVHLNELYKIADIEKKNISSCESGFDILKRILQNTPFESLLCSFDSLCADSFNFSKVLLRMREDIPSSLEVDARYLIENDIGQWEAHWKKYTSQVLRENRTLLSFRNYMSLGKTQDVSSENGVALLTAHMSKGLQYEAVFVIGLSEGTFPDYRAVNGGDAQMEQEKNNMYVAVTRAKRLCYLSYPNYKKMPWGDMRKQTASRFLSGIDITEL